MLRSRYVLDGGCFALCIENESAYGNDSLRSGALYRLNKYNSVSCDGVVGDFYRRVVVELDVCSAE